MERIGIMSDTGGNMELLEKAAEFMLSTLKVSKIYHLGNKYGDADSLARGPVPLVRVPATSDKEYAKAKIPVCVEEDILGLKITLCHEWEDIPRRILCKTDIVLVGGTGTYRIQEGQALLAIMNPGHLLKPVVGNRKATFGMLLIDQADVMMEIYEVDGNVRYSRWIQRREEPAPKGRARRR